MAEGAIAPEQADIPHLPSPENKKGVIDKLMPKVQEILAKEGPVDEARMLKLMDELEKTGEIKDRVHTLGEGKDRTIILKTPVQTSREKTSYDYAVNPHELLPIGKIKTEQSEWLILNRKGFLKTIVIDGQEMTVDEASQFFSIRRHPDSARQDGDTKPHEYYIDKARSWAKQVQGYVKDFGERNREDVYNILNLSDYPPAPEKFHHNLYGTNASQETVKKVDAEEHLYYLGQQLHPESGWNRLYQTEDERKASEAIGYKNPLGWEMYQGPSFYKVKSPDFVQTALAVNAAPQS
jgi:hypothetical protein